MTRDYVKYKKKRRRQSNRTALWFFVVIICAVTAGMVFYICDKREISTMAMSQFTTYFPHLFQKKKLVPVTKKVTAHAHETVKPIHFDFYDELPKMSVAKGGEMDVTEDTESTDEEAPSSIPVASGGFILQVGVFHHEDAATRYQAALESAGLTVEVVELQEGKDVVYRLQQGPYDKLEEAQAAKKELTARGITCDVQEVS